MSALKQKLARLGATAGVLAVSTAAILAVGGVSASSALAACPTNPLNIEGRGSSLQKIAQQEWTGREVPSNEVKAIPHTLLSPKRGYAAECEKATVSYTSTSSGSALTTFRYNGTGKIENGNNGEEHGYTYVATDDAPTAAQIKNAEEATIGGAEKGANALIIPKIQTAIAVIYNPPANCTLTFDKTHGITSAQLNGAFGGEGVKNWNGFTKASPTGAGCANNFKRVVRAEGSGTTFQFKNYLAVDGGAAMPCKLTGWEEPAEVEVKETTAWANMRAIKLTGEAPNTTWPQKSTCPGSPETLTEVETAKGGGALVKYVAEHPGTIGYASLPDAKSSNNIEGKAKIAWLQNASTEVGTYSTPELIVEGVSKEESNCGERQYTVPVGAREGESGESIDWSKVFGAKPTIGGTLYPLCTLTYGLSWSSYEKAGYAEPGNKAENLVSYTSYVLGTGQSVKHWYQPLPHPAAKENNVLAAAKLAASKIAK